MRYLKVKFMAVAFVIGTSSLFAMNDMENNIQKLVKPQNETFKLKKKTSNLKIGVNTKNLNAIPEKETVALELDSNYKDLLKVMQKQFKFKNIKNEVARKYSYSMQPDIIYKE